MKILSNKEFMDLTSDKLNRLSGLAKSRFEKDPSGNLLEEDLNTYINVCACAGDKDSVRWLKSLLVLSKNGTIAKVKAGMESWPEHKIDVHRRFAQKEIPFDLNTTVVLKENGRRGMVVDFIPEEDKYVVVFNPFQVSTYPAKELSKVASVCESVEDEE